jgi:uroporphyrinogen-III synthase
VLRPEPGAGRTAARAAALGLEPVVAPLFDIVPVPWPAPDPAGFDAVLLTSANAVRHGGPSLRAFLHLPCFAVGEATAEAARAAGFHQVLAGRGDGTAAAAMMADRGSRRALHPCGRDFVRVEEPRLTIEPRIVYAAEAGPQLAEAARSALASGAVALVHSARAGRRLAELVEQREGVLIAAISLAASAAAGDGWAGKWVAAEPRDEALLELAAELCNYGGDEEGASAPDGL